ncbi:hypothetical protein BRM3_01435 [Brachybacterium huguangmaarense]|uniref:PH domain-containing protein n=1 Tax=Brachybacterium huguangmaarense TaxID=1652028 RepID=A0ABY6G1Z3_9MICO|nr:hypothetical protein [Brachybacterium huguangmaarense]UYG17127.1 hypothetical protein BRM3_01435 [Brachybacterium huguangmaarense]
MHTPHETTAVPRDHGEPSHVFGPMRSAVMAALVGAITFVVVLEFLVLTSFIGQRLWNDDALFHEVLFTLPLVLWLLILVAAVVICLRTITSWLTVGEQGFATHGLFRRAVSHEWSDVARLVAVRDVTRVPLPTERVPAPEDPYDGVYVVGTNGRRLATFSGRLFGARAQHAVIDQARAAGTEVEEVDQLAPRELRTRVPRSIPVADLHPGLVLLAVVAFYAAHNILTFIVWGL